LLKRGASVDFADYEQITPLVAAASEGHAECVVELLKLDADTSMGGPLGTAEQAAAMGGHKKCVQLLQEHASKRVR